MLLLIFNDNLVEGGISSSWDIHPNCAILPNIKVIKSQGNYLPIWFSNVFRFF